MSSENPDNKYDLEIRQKLEQLHRMLCAISPLIQSSKAASERNRSLIRQVEHQLRAMDSQ